MKVPKHTMDGLQRYIEWGVPTGSFLKAVLSNDLFDAFACADIENQHSMFAIVNWIYNEAPGNCHGSVETYYAWIEMHRVKREKVNNEL